MQSITSCFDPDFVEPERNEETKMTTSQIIGFNIRQFIRRIHGRVETAVYQSCERTLRSLANRMKRINPHISVADRITDHLSYDSLV